MDRRRFEIKGLLEDENPLEATPNTPDLGGLLSSYAARVPVVGAYLSEVANPPELNQGSELRGSEFDTSKRIEPDFYLDPYSIVPLHEIEDEKKLADLTESMEAQGWVGDPIVVLDLGNEYRAASGTHRIEAAKNAEIDVPVISIEFPDDASEEEKYLYDQLINGSEDSDRMEAMKQLANLGIVPMETIRLFSN